MRCSEFRDLHFAYVDDTLAGVELVRVQCHLAECPPCAALDARVRRALMLARNLPPIEPSPEFTRRLEARLAAARREESWPCGRGSFRTVAALGAIASVAMLGYVAQGLFRPVGALTGAAPAMGVLASAPAGTAPAASIVAARQGAHIVLRVARTDTIEVLPAGVPSGVADSEFPAAPAIVASVSAGVPIWPVGLLAEPGTAHFASFDAAH